MCSTDAFFEKRAGGLCGYLMNRGYNKKQVLREIDRARRIPRDDTLLGKQSCKNSRNPIVVSYHPMLPNIAEILHRFHPVLQSSRRCKEVIPGVPMVAFRRPKSFKEARSRYFRQFQH